MPTYERDENGELKLVTVPDFASQLTKFINALQRSEKALNKQLNKLIEHEFNSRRLEMIEACLFDHREKLQNVLDKWNGGGGERGKSKTTLTLVK